MLSTHCFSDRPARWATYLSYALLIGFNLVQPTDAADKGVMTDYSRAYISLNSGAQAQPGDIRMDFYWSPPQDDGRSYPLPNNRRLPSGSRFTLRINNPTKAGYLYVLHQDSHQQRNELFQLSKQTSWMHAGETRELPGPEANFELDQNTGQETFYLIASPKPIPNPVGTDTTRYKGIRLVPNPTTGQRVQCTAQHPYCVSQFSIRHE